MTNAGQAIDRNTWTAENLWTSKKRSKKPPAIKQKKDRRTDKI